MENNNAMACKQKEQKESTKELVSTHLHNIHAKQAP